MPAQQITVNAGDDVIQSESKKSDAEHPGDDFVRVRIFASLQNSKPEPALHGNHFGDYHTDEGNSEADADAC